MCKGTVQPPKKKKYGRIGTFNTMRQFDTESDMIYSFLLPAWNLSKESQSNANQMKNGKMHSH